VNIKVHGGPWFSASTDIKHATSTMSSGMNIIGEKAMEIGVYDMILDTPFSLTPDPEFSERGPKPSGDVRLRNLRLFH